MFGYKFVKKKDIEKLEFEILSLQNKNNVYENTLKTERSNSRDLYGENCRLRLEMDVLKKEMEKLKKELGEICGETENKETEQIVETPKTEVPKKKKNI